MTSPAHEIVLDTNVLISAMKSRTGASFKLLSLVDSGRFRVNVSVPLVLEYEAVAMRHEAGVPLSEEDVEAILDHLCAVGRRNEIFFLWRPFLRDPGDDLVLEAAVSGGCAYIVTHNIRDFAGCESFGIQAVTPGEFLKVIGESR
ncbi:MAG TPA: putative toxin-antitoxin system toxin component, PIN family [Longimicrobium sp.]|nr:putative toxin-antitoxin system toxin component, PIN family [Longimicrobium sp.]